MITIPFTEFRRNASGLLSRVEQGEVFLVMRHGRPIAEIGPVTPSEGRIPAWKKPGVRLVSKGVRLSASIIQERAHERVL